MDVQLITFGAFAFFWGACWGSFTNVLIHRIPLDMSVVSPPSACPKCERPIRWYENIPILSYIFLRAKCAGCSTSISLRYPLIEATAGAWSLALAMRHLWPVWSQPELWIDDLSPLLQAVGGWLWLEAFVCALIAITFIDLEFTFIPDEVSIPMILIGCLGGFTLTMNQPLEHFWGMVGGWGVILCIRWIGWLLFRREAMGLGDAKLLSLIGVFLGWRVIPWILFASAVQGIIAAGVAIAYTKYTGRTNALTLTSAELDEIFGEEGVYPSDKVHVVIPYGPFLCLAAFEVLMIGPQALLSWWVEWLMYP
jgi:leader peptidase (prepilin peptidase) / N-methyltransferase